VATRISIEFRRKDEQIHGKGEEDSINRGQGRLRGWP